MLSEHCRPVVDGESFGLRYDCMQILQLVGQDWLIREASENALKGVVGQLLTALLVPKISDIPQGSQVGF